MSQHQILIVGCGSIGERHLRCFLRTGRAEVSICDNNLTRLREIQHKYGVPTYDDVQAAWADRRFDGTVICTPAHQHVELALAGLGHGAALLIEKPLSVNLDQVAALQEEVRHRGQYVAVAYTHHVRPGITEVRELIRRPALGAVLHITIQAGQHFPSFRPAYREIYYAHHETGGGAIQDALTHLANTVEWLVGATTRLYCEAAHQCLEGVSVEDTVNVAARHGDILASYALNQFQAPDETTILIHCARGSVKIEFHKERWSVWSGGQTSWEHHAAPVRHRDDLFVAQANEFNKVEAFGIVIHE